MMTDANDYGLHGFYIQIDNGEEAKIIEIDSVDVASGVAIAKGNNPFEDKSYTVDASTFTMTFEIDEQEFRKLWAWLYWKLLNAQRLS